MISSALTAVYSFYAIKNGFFSLYLFRLAFDTKNKMNMNRVTPQKPVMNWREREALKEKQRKEDEARRAEEERLRGVRMTETNFPAFGGAGAARPKPITQGAFAKMAAEWKTHEDVETYREQRRKLEEAADANWYASRRGFRASRFSPQAEDLEDEAPQRPQTQDERDGWEKVDTKKHRVIRERHPEDDAAPMEEPEEQNADLYEYQNTRY